MPMGTVESTTPATGMKEHAKTIAFNGIKYGTFSRAQPAAVSAVLTIAI